MTCEKHEIKINLGTANYNKHKNKGYSFRELINNSKEDHGTPNAKKIKINYVDDKNLLSIVDDGKSMQNNLAKCFNIQRQSGKTIYHNWGEGLNDSIGSLIKDSDSRSMVYIFTWEDKTIDVGCMFSSALMGESAYAGLHTVNAIHLHVPTANLLRTTNIGDYKMSKDDNPFAAYQDLSEIIEKARKYSDSDYSGTAFEIYYPDIIIDDNNNIMCESDGKTLSQFITESYLPQSIDQKICNFPDMFGEQWNNRKFEIFINDKLIPLRQWKSPGIGENPSEVFTLYKEGTSEELGKLQIVQSIKIASSRNGWYYKFQKTKEPDQDGSYIFLFNDIVVSEKIYRGSISPLSKITGYPKNYFKQKYDEQNNKRATSIYKNITKNISNDNPSLGEGGDWTHPLTDQIISHNKILKLCEKASEIADNDGSPSLNAHIEKFLMRFCLLPYTVYILPKNPKIEFGRMKDNFEPSNELLQAAKFVIGKWAYNCEIKPYESELFDSPENSNPSITNESLPIDGINREENSNAPINNLSMLGRSGRVGNASTIPAQLNNNPLPDNVPRTPHLQANARPRTRRRILNEDNSAANVNLAANTLVNINESPATQNNKRRKPPPKINWENKKRKILEYLNNAKQVKLPELTTANSEHSDIIKKKVLQDFNDKLTQIFDFYQNEDSWEEIDKFNQKILAD